MRFISPLLFHVLADLVTFGKNEFSMYLFHFIFMRPIFILQDIAGHPALFVRWLPYCARQVV